MGIDGCNKHSIKHAIEHSIGGCDDDDTALSRFIEDFGYPFPRDMRNCADLAGYCDRDFVKGFCGRTCGVCAVYFMFTRATTLITDFEPEQVSCLGAHARTHARTHARMQEGTYGRTHARMPKTTHTYAHTKARTYAGKHTPKA